jgi:hypothetical protein
MVVSTVVDVGTLAFGLYNMKTFKQQIWPNLAIRQFYIYGLLCVALQMWQVWTPS